MNLEEFARTLSEQYTQWGTLDVYPIAPLFIHDVWGMSERTTLYEQDFVDFFSSSPDIKVGVYFLDGPHGYQGTLDGLEMAIPILADKSLIVMDDYNWDGVRQATLDWVDAHKSHAEVLFSITTPLDSKAWWNGIGVIGWRK